MIMDIGVGAGMSFWRKVERMEEGRGVGREGEEPGEVAFGGCGAVVGDEPAGTGWVLDKYVCIYASTLSPLAVGRHELAPLQA